MYDKENSRIETERANPEHEAAAAKLWAVYVSEAEKYDKALVESWKSDMQGMLIFAGLFSASLTAFLIESYKTLTRDSGNDTVRLLAQISQQLGASANGTTLVIPSDLPFTPTTSSIICNTLWFISLGLSLACALIATLLDQWARDFIHRTEMHASPVVRARVISYLYYGLKRFKMHSVVRIIPLLLHTSLLFFFAGLVAFLIPVNTTVMAVMVVLLVIITGVYSLLTVLPSLYPDCPYRTPLSGAYWHLMRSLSRARPRRRSVSDDAIGGNTFKSPVEFMFEKATKYSNARTKRDGQALAWTVKSLSDDAELEPFVEAIPEVLWAANQRLYNYDAPIRRLMEDPHLELFDRIHNLLRGCDTGLLTPEAAKRRQISCYRTIWALGSLYMDCALPEFLDFGATFTDLRTMDPDIVPYAVSAQAVQARASLIHEINIMSCRIVLDYLDKAQSLNLLPYRFTETLGLISPQIYPLSPAMLERVLSSLEWMIRAHINHPDFFLTHETSHWLDTVFGTMLSYWATTDTQGNTMALPWALIQYLNHRKSVDSVQTVVWSLGHPVWKSIPVTIQRGPLMGRNFAAHSRNPVDSLSESLHAVWTLIYRRGPRNPQTDVQGEDISNLEMILDLVGQLSPSSIAVSLIVTAKNALLDALGWESPDPGVVDLVSRSKHPILPPETSAPTLINVEDGTAAQVLQHRCTEARLVTLSEFIESCCSNTLPFRATDMLRDCGDFFPQTVVHPIHQRRFVTAVKNLFSGGFDIEDTFLYGFLSLPLFGFYAPSQRAKGTWRIRGVFSPGGFYPESASDWLDDIDARETLKAILTSHLLKSPPTHNSETVALVEEITTQLEVSHPEPPRPDAGFPLVKGGRGSPDAITAGNIGPCNSRAEFKLGI
ncbi:hypothetical protein B0H13DRAFT_2265401 [Mycena leptocephala]|nr:hypothetical protein B0H13DRAFT_2265401 [Mycena leptocephala]